MILFIYSVLITIILFVLCFGIINLIKKVEMYEDEIIKIHNSCETILKEMRIIDDRQIFEKDDEVGTIFQQLVEVLGQLRYLLYDADETNEEETEEDLLAL